MLCLYRDKMQIEYTFLKWAVKLENYSLMGKPMEKNMTVELEQLTGKGRN